MALAVIDCKLLASYLASWFFNFHSVNGDNNVLSIGLLQINGTYDIVRPSRC